MGTEMNQKEDWSRMLLHNVYPVFRGPRFRNCELNITFFYRCRFAIASVRVHHANEFESQCLRRTLGVVPVSSGRHHETTPKSPDRKNPPQHIEVRMPASPCRRTELTNGTVWCVCRGRWASEPGREKQR